MNATVALNGQGGWPMTCFLTPDGRPFFCGTYYPKEGFLQLLSAVSATWRERRGEVEEASDISPASSAGWRPASRRRASVVPELCDHAVATLLQERDAVHGGFGGAPKFPPSALLEALLRHFERTGSPAALAAVAHTANAMARGGIYDQLGGGFARYSVDNAWVVPHFEKMLYDNALLLRAYAHWARRTGDPLARRISAQTARFLLDDLADGDMFTSSLDADTDGREGSTYVWTPAQLNEVLGPDDGPLGGKIFGVTQSGHVRARHLGAAGPASGAPTNRRRRPGESAPRCWRRGSLASSPGRDDKVVSSWNGLAITALAEASVVLEEGGAVADLPAQAGPSQPAVDQMQASSAVAQRRAASANSGASSATLASASAVIASPFQR